MTKKKLEQVLAKLRKAGYNPTFEESTDWQLEDDEIKLSDTINIQLCQDGLFGLGEDEGDGVMSYPYVDTIEEVLEQIKQYEVVI